MTNENHTTKNVNSITDWWKFDIDDNKALEMVQGNKFAVLKFLQDNSELIKNICLKFCKKNIIYTFPNYYQPIMKNLVQNYELQDFINQVWADAMFFNFSDSKSLYKCIIKSIIFIPLGGYTARGAIMCDELKEISIDKPINSEDDITILEMIKDSRDIDYYIKNENETINQAFENALQKIAKKMYPENKLKRLEFIRRF